MMNGPTHQPDKATSGSLSKYSLAEQELRIKLAAAYRIVARLGWDEIIYNHISVRVPADIGNTAEDTFLLNPFGLRYDEITASSLVKVDLGGNIVDPGNTEWGVNFAGFVIHSALHQARADVNCVMHTHEANVTAVASLKCGLMPLTQNAQICGPVAYHEYEGLAVSLEERERLVNDLGDKEILFLRNHGVVTASGTIEAALFRMLYSYSNDTPRLPLYHVYLCAIS
eukprot:TRINITY_DN1619_c0_g1_i1.p1 TRINITY_DN1619_c0_g1~~TRINITY_DN1619_c0_g1_i1.p1  ORF type:complete len:227 (-),score=8.94 TRINITY_DN1619_c0_g1_i1:352-1032(-)